MKFIFALAAGLLTTLSPCVLPILPFVTASSLNKSRLGPAFLAGGLLISFVGVSLLISSSGYVLGINPATLRKVSGLLLAASGVLFLSQKLADGFAARLSALSNRANQVSVDGTSWPLAAEFLNGALLGVVWTPCSGPSLGAALGLAAQQGTLMKAGSVLFVFGIGAVLPLTLFAYGARGLVEKIGRQSKSVYIIKKIFGVLVVTFGISLIFDWDRILEAALTGLLPETWLGVITKF
jgi:cytochrome c-type biogenesis protein